MMSIGLPALDSLISELSRLPGIGRKSAQRLGLFILKSEGQYAHNLARAIQRVKEEIRICRTCFNISQAEQCRICSDPKRDRNKICVVEDIVDVMAIEDSNEYNGLYHVLGGVISPLSGISADTLHIHELVERVKNEEPEEILMAINPSTEGEATMIYIAKLLQESGSRLTRIASGIPIGSHLEFMDTVTIGRAISTRREL